MNAHTSITFAASLLVAGEALTLEDSKMVALEAYATYERRDVPLAPGKH